MTVNETDSKVLVKGHDTRCSGPVCPARKSWRHSRPSMSAIASGRQPKPFGAGEGDPGQRSAARVQGWEGLVGRHPLGSLAGPATPHLPSHQLIFSNTF
jgi:hypothetical protein